MGGLQRSLTIPPVVVDGRSLVPVRFVSEAMGAAVDWDGATQTITITSPDSSPVPTGAEAATVARVIDGDTVELSDGRSVRLIGVDTPETVHPTKKEEAGGWIASDFTKEALTGRRVWLEYDVDRTDRYTRTLAYVWLADGQLFNALLLREGFGRVLTVPPNVKYVETFVKMQEEARTYQRGLWAPEPSVLAPVVMREPLQERDAEAVISRFTSLILQNQHDESFANLLSPTASALRQRFAADRRIGNGGLVLDIPGFKRLAGVFLSGGGNANWFKVPRVIQKPADATLLWWHFTAKVELENGQFAAYEQQCEATVVREGYGDHVLDASSRHPKLGI